MGGFEEARREALLSVYTPRQTALMDKLKGFTDEQKAVVLAYLCGYLHDSSLFWQAVERTLERIGGRVNGKTS